MPTVAAALIVQPAAQSFSGRKVGAHSKPKVVKAINKSTLTIQLTGAAVAGDFVMAGGTCGATLAPKKRCTYAVSFAPTTTGRRTGTLTIDNNASNGRRVVNLSGTGK